MKKAMLLFVIAGTLLVGSCKKNQDLEQTIVYSDDGLLGTWVLDSTTYIGGYLIQNPDYFTSLKGTKMYVTFLKGGLIEFNYSSYNGGGEYTYLEDHKIKVTKFSDVNMGYPESQFLGEFITRMIAANRDSNINGKIKIYYNNTSGIMFFSPK